MHSLFIYRAYNTLIGDSIQDHLFQSPEASSPPPLLVTTNALIPPSSSEDTTTTSSNSADMLYKTIPTSSEGTTDTAVSSESVVQMREEPGFKRRKKSVRNRKSAVYSSGDRDADNIIQLVTVKGKEEEGEGVDREEQDKETTFDNGETNVEGPSSIKSIRDSFEKKGLLYQVWWTHTLTALVFI